MTKDEILDSARRLPSPSVRAAAALEASVGACAEQLTAALRPRDDLEELIGPGNVLLMISNHGCHFRYMASLAALYDPKSFVESVIWVYRTYLAHGFSPEYWRVMLPECRRILKGHLAAEDYAELDPFYLWLHAHIDEFVALSATETSVYENLGGLT